MKDVESLAAMVASWQQGQPCCWQPAFGQQLAVTDCPVTQVSLIIESDSRHDKRLRELLTVRYQQPGRFARCFIAAGDDGSLILLHPLQSGDDLHAAINLLMTLHDSQPEG